MVLLDINIMIKKITLNEDHLKLIPFFFIQEFDDVNVGVTKEQLFNIGSHLLEDIAFILNLTDKAIPLTENDSDGRAFDDATEKYMLDIYNYISDNLCSIEEIIHQFATKGGVSVGTYKTKTNELIWEKVD